MKLLASRGSFGKSLRWLDHYASSIWQCWMFIAHELGGLHLIHMHSSQYLKHTKINQGGFFKKIKKLVEQV